MALVYALLGRAILIALLGIGSTRALSTVERTHEIGLLRAVGMTRSQLRGSIRSSSWPTLAVVVLLAGLSGMLAAVLPSRRAAKFGHAARMHAE